MSDRDEAPLLAMTDESNRSTAAREVFARLVADRTALAEPNKRATTKTELRTRAHAEYLRETDTPPR